MFSGELLGTFETGDLVKFSKLIEADKSLINTTGQNGYSLLIMAILARNLPFINELIKQGADVNKPSAQRPHSTPLIFAARSNYFDGVSLLLANGAYPNLPRL